MSLYREREESDEGQKQKKKSVRTQAERRSEVTGKRREVQKAGNVQRRKHKDGGEKQTWEDGCNKGTWKKKTKKKRKFTDTGAANKQKQTGREGEGLKRHVGMKGLQDKTENKGTQRKTRQCLVYETCSLRLVNCPKYEFVVSPLVCVLILCLKFKFNNSRLLLPPSHLVLLRLIVSLHKTKANHSFSFQHFKSSSGEK